jgi:hypothetical protein
MPSSTSSSLGVKRDEEERLREKSSGETKLYNAKSAAAPAETTRLGRTRRIG